MSDATLRNYLRQIEKVYQAGNATEHSYRASMQELLKTLDASITATNEPKRIKCGAPDFIITKKQTPLGYLETKDIGISLDQAERSDQMKRYLGSLANLILTDYIEFRWYVTGEHRMTARIAKVGANHKLLPDTNGIAQTTDLLRGFILTQTPTVSNPKELATRMATIAQLIRNAIRLAFESEEGGGSLHIQREGFKQVLLPDLTHQQFADMYAQTICYGLFAARCNTKPGITFTREHAAYDIPKTNPFLRKMFNYIAGPDLDERIVWIVDDLAELLNRSDMATILQDFGKRTRQEDPVVHFYETFLAQYDPKLRELRGVYYTPEPVVSYIVRSVDYLLKEDFGLTDGLGDTTILRAVSSDGKSSLQTHKVQILDPATGTGTFLYYVIKQIYESFKDNRGMWSSYVSEHLLPRLFGFELLMAPYAVAHLKLGLQLGETGYDFRSNERLGVYLTNTLEEEYEVSQVLFADWLVEEAEAAGNVKYDAPVMIVLGNPPYSGHSANSSWKETKEGKKIRTFIGELVQDYYIVDGIPLGERNPKWLQDDYVKFIRFAQWRIERTGYGILAFITNHGYLDNPTFRGMRQSLMRSFDEIYVLDLHGNSKKKERSPDSTKDENVFDIQQGVAIGIFIKRQKRVDVRDLATVHHTHLWGPREVFQEIGHVQQLIGGKYHWLAKNNITTTEWLRITPNSPLYMFVPQDINLLEEYQHGWRAQDIFPRTLLGPNSHRDDFAIAFTEEEAERRIVDLANQSLTDEILREKYALHDNRDWSLKQARKQVPKSVSPIECIYRPFDFRFMLYGSFAFDYHRPEINDQLLQKNVALISTKQTKEEFSVLVTNRPAGQHKLATPYDGSYLSPLYIYPDTTRTSLFDSADRRANLAPEFIKDITNKLNMQFIQDSKGDLKLTFGPEDIFNYVYAVLHSPAYRTRYAEFLKVDFPRLPLTSNPDLFRVLCTLGNKLVDLHLLEKYGQGIPNYPEPGNNKVERVEYTHPTDTSDQGHVWINKTQYFDGVSAEAWEFHIGGYQVCHRWLKDRKGHTLSFDDIKHYQRIVGALAETITLMEQVDATINEYGGWPIK